MTIHTFKGNGAPTFVPSSESAHYLDMMTNTHYLATGTASPADWMALAPNLVTAEGTAGTASADTESLSGLARRIAYMQPAKVAVAPSLRAGSNVVALSAFVGDSVDPTVLVGFDVVGKRGSQTVELDWKYLPETGEIQIDGALAGDVPIAVQRDVGGVNLSKLDALSAVAEERFEQELAAAGYTSLGSYAAGLSVASLTQYFKRDGRLYSAGESAVLPYSTTGDWATEGGNFVRLGDDLLRREIVSGSLLTASMISGVSRNIADISTLRATAARFDGEQINLIAYGEGFANGGGGGLLYWDAESTAADDGGITFAVSGVLTGRWVRRVERFVDAAWYGLPLASGSCLTQDAAIEAYCFTNKVSAWYGPGVYDFGENNWSWSGPRIAGQPLKDYAGVRIYSCPEAIFRTTSVGGADVMQCCGIKNFGVIGYPTVTAILNNVDDTLSGSNALSLVFGAVDCVFELTVKDMPGIYKSTGAIDGGQGFSIQPGANNTNPYSNVILRGSVDGATQGFGCDFELDNQVEYPLMGIRLDLDIANCYRGVVIAGAAATVVGAAYTGITGSVRVRNCQQAYVNMRSLGTSLDVEVVNTLPKESLVKHAFNPSVIVTNILAAKDGAARINGRVRTVDTLLSIGGTAMGAGQFGSTSEFTLDHAVTFAGATTQVEVIDFGGNAVDKSCINLSHVTTGYADLSVKGSNTVTINGSAITPAAYPGDASLTAMAAPIFKAVFTAPLTGARTVLLPSAARVGDTVRVVRLAAATGSTLSVGSLVNLVPGTWAEVTYSGTAWAITGQGSV